MTISLIKWLNLQSSADLRKPAELAFIAEHSIPRDLATLICLTLSFFLVLLMS